MYLCPDKEGTQYNVPVEWIQCFRVALSVVGPACERTTIVVLLLAVVPLHVLQYAGILEDLKGDSTILSPTNMTYSLELLESI